MKQVVLFVALTAAIFAEPSYFVLNGFAETISSGEWLSMPVNNILTVGSMPYQILEAEGWIWVVCSGDSKIQMFDTHFSGIWLYQEFPLPAGSNPYLLFVRENKVYTTLWVYGGIGVINWETGEVFTTDSFCLGPQGVYADSSYIYVSAGNLDPISFVYGPGQLWRLRHDGTPLDFIQIGLNPQQIIRGPDENLHIVCTGDYFSTTGVVYIVNPSTFAVIDSVNIGGWPQRLAFDEYTGVVYSVTSDWSVSGSGRILAYDGRTHRILWDAGSTGNYLLGTGGIGLAAYDNYLYIPSMDSSFVEIYHVDRITMTQTRVGIYTAGHGSMDVCVVEPMGIEEGLPKNRELTVHPSPFNRECLISIPEETDEVLILDLLGRVICDVANGGIQNEMLRWRPNANISSGVYLIEARGSIGKHTGRVVYLK